MPEKLASLRELQRDALAEMRALIFELRPGQRRGVRPDPGAADARGVAVRPDRAAGRRRGASSRSGRRSRSRRRSTGSRRRRSTTSSSTPAREQVRLEVGRVAGRRPPAGHRRRPRLRPDHGPRRPPRPGRDALARRAPRRPAHRRPRRRGSGTTIEVVVPEAVPGSPIGRPCARTELGLTRAPHGARRTSRSTATSFAGAFPRRSSLTGAGSPRARSVHVLSRLRARPRRRRPRRGERPPHPRRRRRRPDARERGRDPRHPAPLRRRRDGRARRRGDRPRPGAPAATSSIARPAPARGVRRHGADPAPPRRSTPTSRSSPSAGRPTSSTRRSPPAPTGSCARPSSPATCRRDRALHGPPLAIEAVESARPTSPVKGDRLPVDRGAQPADARPRVPGPSRGAGLIL